MNDQGDRTNTAASTIETGPVPFRLALSAPDYPASRDVLTGGEP